MLTGPEDDVSASLPGAEFELVATAYGHGDARRKLDVPVAKTLRVDLYYTGLTDTARVLEKGGSAKRLKLARDHSVEIPVRVPAQGMAWWAIE